MHWTDGAVTGIMAPWSFPRSTPMSVTQSWRDQAEAFCRQHRSGEMIVLPNAWDPGSAALMVAAGFPVIATTSAGIAYARGCRDGEVLGRAGMLKCVEEIVARCPVPVTADLEAGYGATPRDVGETVSQAIAIGLVGCNIEDSDPRSGRLVERDLAVARIRAGREAADRLGMPFALNARTDPYLVGHGDAEANFAEAVRRANAYLAAGATCAFVPGPGDRATVGRLVAAIDGPLNILGAFAGRPSMTLDEIRRLGVRRVSIGGSLMLSVLTQIRAALAAIRERGDLGYAVTAITNREMDSLMATPRRGPASGG
jgi:2-methylisocitrate lyase-like PEP mutase family enzyme